jgi:hypothetical protein
MCMIYARIDLDKTNYKYMETHEWKWLTHPDPLMVKQLNEIYVKYCRYKKFKSVMPIFDSEYTDRYSDVIGYYDNEKLVAFSLIRRLAATEYEAVQFAWNYENPKLRLGIRSLEHECCILKAKGAKYLYLGEAAEYKSKIDGFEILGPL